MPRRAVTLPRLAMLALALSACRYTDCSSESNRVANELTDPSLYLSSAVVVGIIVVLALRHSVGSIVFGALGILIGTIAFVGSSCAAALSSSSSTDTRAGVAIMLSIICFGLGIFALVRGVGGTEKRPAPSPPDDDTPHWSEAHRDMTIGSSRITAQGLLPIPPEVRRRLGLVAGTFVAWKVEGDDIILSPGERSTESDEPGS